MKHYLCVLKNETFQLIPLTKDAVYILGYWDVTKKMLILQHKEQYSDYQFVAKIDEVGNPIQKGGKQQIQRSWLNFPYKYELESEQAIWFIEEFVQNPNIALPIIKKNL